MITNDKRLVDLTVAELKILLEEAKRNSEPSSPATSRQWNIADIAGMELALEITGLKKPTIYALVSKSRIPHMKKGKKLFFSRKELIEWIKTGKRMTVDELRKEVRTIKSLK